MQVQSVELLLLLGQVHQAAGAPLTALPYVLSCLLHSTDLHMDLLVSLFLVDAAMLHMTCCIVAMHQRQTDREHLCC